MKYCLLRPKLIQPLVAIIVLSLFAAAAVARPEPRMRDPAELISTPAVEQVNSIVREIRQRFGKDLTIVTFEKIPENQAANFVSKAKERFYEDWIIEEARAAGTNGVFILIVKNPGHLQIGVGDLTRQHDFTNKDRDELTAMMLKAFRDKQFDRGLIDGAKFVLERIEKNRGGRGVDQPASGSSPATAPATQPATTAKSDPDGF